MHIGAITIKNYRSFPSLELTNLPPQVVIVGENAVGKSNLLRALRLVLDTSLPDSLRYLRDEDFSDGAKKPMSGDEIRIEVELTGFDDDDNAKSLLMDSLVEVSQPRRARLTYLYRPKQNVALTGDRVPYEFLVFGGTDDTCGLDPEIRRSISLHVLQALRNAEEDLQSWNRSPLRRLLEGLKIPQDVLEGAQKGVEAASETLTQHSVVKALGDALTLRLRKMTGEKFAVKSLLGIAEGRAENLLRAIRLFVEDGAIRAIGDASLGTANIVFLALLLETFSTEHGLNVTLGTVLAIEEPEAHIHPHVQRVLFRSLLNESRALMLTTHSPHIVSVSKLPSIVLMRRVATKGTLGFTAHSAGLSPAQIADLERYLDVTRAEMLFARGVILVEGIAELYLIPAFARILNYDLDEMGITVCSVHGVDFTPYHRMLGEKAFSIPHVIITDGDPGKDDGNVFDSRSGIVRSRRILNVMGQDTTDLDAAIASKDVSKARKQLAASGLFVGTTTMEADIVSGAAAAMDAAFDEVESSPTAQTDFHANVGRVMGGDMGDWKALVQRIDDVGKGRFAQHLAGQLSRSNTPPEYIREAIEHVVKLVYPHA